jgi:hypothetical protein
MSEITITLKLPDKLATEAEAQGLLKAKSIESLVREELRRQRVGRFFKATDKLVKSSPALTEADVETEIQEARKVRRRLHASGG